MNNSTDEQSFLTVSEDKTHVEHDREQAKKAIEEADGFILLAKGDEGGEIVSSGEWSLSDAMVAKEKLNGALTDLIEALAKKEGIL